MPVIAKIEPQLCSNVIENFNERMNSSEAPREIVRQFFVCN